MSQGYVLIAEPDARLARTFASLAREAALESVIAKDGIEAKRIVAERGSPSLIVTNLVLPKLDGFGLLESLRRTVSAREVPALVVSSSMQLRSTASSLRQKLGIAEVTASGMVTNSLRSAVRRALESVHPRPASSPSPSLVGSRPPTPEGPSAGASRTPASEPAATGSRSPALRAPLAPPPLPAASRAPIAGVPSQRSAGAPERLARIEALGLVDHRPPDAMLQQLVEETARALHVPIALVSLVLEDKQWFKAHVGLSGDLLRDRGTPIEQSFCRHVVEADTPAALIVPDARRHPMFAKNALVTRGLVGSYAGAPLLTPDGVVLGTLCAIDSEPLALEPAQIDALTGLARRVAGEIALGSAPRGSPASAHEDPKGVGEGAFEAVLAQLDEGIVLLGHDRTLQYVNAALAELLALTPDELRGWSFRSFVHRLSALSDDEALLRRLHLHPDGPFVLREQLEVARPQRRVLRFCAKPIRTPGAVAQLCVISDITAEADLRDASEPPIFFVSE